MNVFDPVEWLEGLPRDASITNGEVRRMWELGMEMRNGGVVVELGVWQGRSACLLARVAKTKGGLFFGIDHFRHPGSSKRAVEERLREKWVDAYAVIIAEPTAEVAWGGMPIDFLHVDADHSSPGIDRDCEKFIPLVRKGGVVAFDDYGTHTGEPTYPDVKLVADVWCRNEAFEDLGLTEGMKFWRRL